MSNLSNELVKVFLSLFKGREDVFATRWERDGKSGYMPAYDLDWNEYSKHKAKGGTLRDFPAKQYSALTQQRITNHLTGKEVIGLYPLLPDNTSWFIVADFDESPGSKKTWIEDCRLFIDACSHCQIPAYLERSRSGKGGHVWIFFEAPYPAYKSRKIVLHILELASIISPFDKNSNYDRMFPNQDYHSGEGLGNLIALPLQKKALENSNSCFIDPDSQIRFEDQYPFLQTIQKVSTAHLNEIYNTISHSVTDDAKNEAHILSDQTAVSIILNNKVSILRKQLTTELITFLRDHLNFVNSDFIIKKKLGKNTFGTAPYFKMLCEKDGFVFMPRGFIGNLVRFCIDKKISYHLVDERKKLTEVNYRFNAALYEYQQAVVNVTHKKEMGVIVAPPGSGKTIMGLCIVANKKQPALIIVHRKQLFDQWVEHIQSFLGIAESFIGKISSGEQKVGTHITVAMIQSLAVIDPASNLFNSFGLIIVDECHHVPAKTFREVISRFSSYFLYGLTATPIRKSNDEKLIFIHIGDVIHEVKYTTENEMSAKKVSVIIRETNLLVPFDYKTDKPETLYQILIHDTARNQLILEDIKTEVNTGKKILVLTERKAHIEVLHQYMKNKYEVITISGEDSRLARKQKLQQIKAGHFQVLISTGQFFGEGTDLDNLDCLILAYPFAFEGKLIQYIGRVQRTEITPVIYDYRDMYIDYLEKQFRQRNRYYKELLNTGLLKRFDELTLLFNEYTFYVNTEDFALPIGCLDLPVEVEKFKDGIIWKLRVLTYDEEAAELMTEIIDYNGNEEKYAGKQRALQFLIIDKIKFRSLDTGKFLRSVILKKNPIIQQLSEPVVVYENPVAIEKYVARPIELTLKKSIKLPFKDLHFLHASVSFTFLIPELNQEIKFEIENPDVRPEFEAIKDYFSKVLKKKMISVDIEIRYKQNEIIAASANSDDIAKINAGIIDSIRFEFVKKEIYAFKGKADNSPMLNTMDNLLSKQNTGAAPLYKSERDLIDDLLNIQNSKHYYHLKYLSVRHLSSILKVRFVINPFSFLFLLDGDKNYHIVWETLNSEEATYIWHFEKSMDVLRNGLKEIEMILNEIKATNKLDYLRKDHNNFSRVMHDYGDVKNGFSTWKGHLEEKLT